MGLGTPAEVVQNTAQLIIYLVSFIATFWSLLVAGRG